MKRILVTGPESTGKTELVQFLARRFGGRAVKEYARDYIGQLERPYVYEDVEHIARQQVVEYEQSGAEKGWLFFDTWLIITKVWFEVVFNQAPGWIDQQISQSNFDLVLLCAPDIPWISDPVRENGGEQREFLFEKYQQELNSFGMRWELVTGKGEERFNRAEMIIKNRAGYDTT